MKYGNKNQHLEKYIPTPRPIGWGGAAIIVNQEKFAIEKMLTLQALGSGGVKKSGLRAEIKRK